MALQKPECNDHATSYRSEITHGSTQVQSNSKHDCRWNMPQINTHIDFSLTKIMQYFEKQTKYLYLSLDMAVYLVFRILLWYFYTILVLYKIKKLKCCPSIWKIPVIVEEQKNRKTARKVTCLWHTQTHVSVTVTNVRLFPNEYSDWNKNTHFIIFCLAPADSDWFDIVIQHIPISRRSSCLAKGVSAL
jgi:hypothetical protein